MNSLATFNRTHNFQPSGECWPSAGRSGMRVAVIHGQQKQNSVFLHGLGRKCAVILHTNVTILRCIAGAPDPSGCGVTGRPGPIDWMHHRIDCEWLAACLSGE
jgi:hypothetical protein